MVAVDEIDCSILIFFFISTYKLGNFSIDLKTSL